MSSSDLPRIAIVAPPWVRVPPMGYGGVERVMALLIPELRSRGYAVTLYAVEGSDFDARCFAPAHWAKDLGQWPDHALREMTYLERVFDDISSRREVDLIHDNCWWTVAPLWYGSALRAAPVVQTVHGPVHEAWHEAYRSIPSPYGGLVGISNAQRNAAPGLPWLGVVYNAIDTSELRVGGREDKERFLLCMGRITPEKGQHAAIEVAKRAGKVGERDVEQRYFKESVEAHIDSDQVVYYPDVSGELRARLLSTAVALLAPIGFPEPFGIVMAEAMASGTPVLAYRRGSVPEVVTDGVTGFLVDDDDIDGMVNAVGRVGEIDLEACAAGTRARFSPRVMADGYVRVYGQALKSAAG